MKNLSSGKVETVIAAADAPLQEMRARSWQGPVYARVETVMQNKLESAVDLQEFKVQD